MKLEHKKFANNLAKMKTLAKRQYYANELEIAEETLEKCGSYFAHCFQESYIVPKPEVESTTQRSRPRPRTQKNTRPNSRTDFSRAHPLEAKDKNGRGQGQGQRTQFF